MFTQCLVLEVDISRRDRLSKSQSEGYENVGKEGEEENGGVRGT
jgi:hypothetical protein